MRTRIAILASGSGTNAENLISYFKDSDQISIDLILTNNSAAFVLERAKKHKVKSAVFTKIELMNTSVITDILKEHQIDFIILAGFLLLIPEYLIQQYPNRIINIHPALLPKYGGKGMYGSKIHERVIENREKFSGITIHLVNEKFDEGKVLFQAKCEVSNSDTPETLAKKIHMLEYEHFPIVVNSYIKDYK